MLDYTQTMTEAEFIEETEQMKASERHEKTIPHSGQKGFQVANVVEMFPPHSTGKTRDKVAAQIGIGSGRQYDKAKKIWEAAKENIEAKALIEKIDSKEMSIGGVYEKIKRPHILNNSGNKDGRAAEKFTFPRWK